MPQTLVHPTPGPLAVTMAHEFKLACIQQASACTGEATWAVRSTHGLACPQDGVVCDICKAYLETDWADILRSGSRCANCHIPVTGHVSDHLSFIAL